MVIATIQVQQWCSDISATRAEDGYDDGLVEARNSADEFYAKLNQLIVEDPGHAKMLEEMRSPFEEYHKTGIRMANAYIELGPAGGNLIMDEFDGNAETIKSLVLDYYNLVETQFTDGLEGIEDKTVSYKHIDFALTNWRLRGELSNQTGQSFSNVLSTGCR